MDLVAFTFYRGYSLMGCDGSSLLLLHCSSRDHQRRIEQLHLLILG